MKKILIIEDDVSIAELERDYLEASDYQTDISHNGREGLQLALDNEYELIILDIMLPELDGFAILKKIREVKETPVLLVTAKISDIDKIKGFSAGADDYIVKPFSPLELTARVKAHISRYEKLTMIPKKIAKKELIIKNLNINPLSRQVTLFNKEINLTNKEFELLLFLANNPEIVFTKEQLLDKVWGENAFVENNTVTVHVNRLREKIEDNPDKPSYIRTVWGKGYKFI